MRRTFSNRTVAVLVAVFTVVCAVILHSNPFGSGDIPWIGATIVSLAGNCFLAYVLTSWAAPYVVSTGGKAGAEHADPQAVGVAEDWIAGTLMSIGAVALLAISLASSDVIVTPTSRLEGVAKTVRNTVESQAPQKYQAVLGAADTWKMSSTLYRTCVPDPGGDKHKGWCVLIRAHDNDMIVLKYGPGPSNAAQFLKWHPDYKPEHKFE
ncbi:MAG: hypothetical protein ACRDKI_09630 [Solirubrobacterales bacterium]